MHNYYTYLYNKCVFDLLKEKRGYISQLSELFKEAKEEGYLLTKIDGSVWQTDLWQPGMAIVDFTNPDACKWYRGKLEALLDMGVDCFKTDFGERIPVKDI